MDVAEVARDLFDEQDALDAVIAAMDDHAWARPTASARWTVADQIGHLTYFDGTAAAAISDPRAFSDARKYLLSTSGATADESDNATLATYRSMDAAQLLAAWRSNRKALAAAAATLANDSRVEWYGPSMGSKSFLTARLMEAWAHGQHICDAVGVGRDATDRLRHIAQLGVITRGWTYINRGQQIPDGEVYVSLQAPSGDTWTWGPADAEASVSGPAIDFCLVVTQCRNLADTSLAVTGRNAQDWIEKAQAFAGPATDGPPATAAG